MVSYILPVVVVLAIGHARIIAAADCGENERTTECAREVSCQPSCTQPSGKVCPRICAISACECAEGYIRDENLRCIARTHCHIQAKRAQPICGPNEIERQCAPHLSCQPSCEQPGRRPCPRMCSPDPCVCKENYIRASRTNRTCVSKDECKAAENNTDCGENEEYSKCAGSCQASCENGKQKPCLLSECIAGCACKKGFSRATSNITSACIKCEN